MIVHLKWLRVRCAINSGIIIFVYCKAGMTAVIPALLFHGKGVVTGSGICFANRSAAQKPHWGFHALRAPPSFLVLFCNQKRTYLAVMLFTKGIKLNLRENALYGKQMVENRPSGYY